MENVNQKQFFCPHCGGHLETKTKFCPYCGKEITSPILKVQLT